MENGDVKVWKNALEIEKFSYDKEIRKRIRNSMNLDNAFVVGHVGRFIHQKNHLFLLDVFDEIYKIDNSAILLLIGKGDLESEIKKVVKNKGLENSVIFTGNRTDVADLYQAMDAFVFPSFYEGLGMVAVEAEIAGLHVYCSENIPGEAKICQNIHFLSLSDSPKQWAKEIAKCKGCERHSMADSASKSGYDIKNSAKEMSDWYLELINGDKNEN